MIINKIKWIGKQVIEKSIIVLFLLIHPEVPEWIKTAIFGTLVFVLTKLDDDSEATHVNTDFSFAEAA